MPAKRPAPATSSTAPAAVAGKKRKMDGDGKNQKKYYAVRSGVVPGVYDSWPECQHQISGFKGAQFKAFLSFGDALAFVQGKNPQVPSIKDKSDKFYAVARGLHTGIFTTWEEAGLAIKGAKRPKYKKFATRAEAESFMRMYGEEGQDEEEEDDEEEEEEVHFELDDEPVEPVKKKAKTAASADGPLTIYTDGSSLSNGKLGAKAGVGVWFGQGDPRNISERLEGELQTNQRAELTAIQRALESIPASQSVQIYTDSKYSIQCTTEWYKSWVKNGWKSSNGTVVKNRDLVEGIRKLIDQRDAAGAKTQLTWVKGHADNVGNQQADILAVAGSRLH